MCIRDRSREYSTALPLHRHCAWHGYPKNVYNVHVTPPADVLTALCNFVAILYTENETENKVHRLIWRRIVVRKYFKTLAIPLSKIKCNIH